MPRMQENPVTTSRLNIRLSTEVKSRIARAATILGQDLTEFAAITLNDKATEILEKNESLLLTGEDYQFFLDALDGTKAAKSSAKSLAASDRYGRGRRKGVRYHLAD